MPTPFRDQALNISSINMSKKDPNILQYVHFNASTTRPRCTSDSRSSTIATVCLSAESSSPTYDTEERGSQLLPKLFKLHVKWCIERKLFVYIARNWKQKEKKKGKDRRASTIRRQSISLLARRGTPQRTLGPLLTGSPHRR